MSFSLLLHRFWQDCKALVGSSDPVKYQGIDVSEHNGDVNFDALRGKIGFAILRCGYGSDFEDQDDSWFTRNVEKCKAAKIPYGAYLYSYAKNKDMAKSEAAHIIRLLGGEDPAFGVWYDVEDKTLPFQEGTVPALCKEWCETLLNAGYSCVGIYANLSTMEDYLKDPILDPYEKWVAQWYSSKCDYPQAGMWQFTDKAVLENQGPFDMNYAYRDYPKMAEGTITQQKFDELMENYLQERQQKPVSPWAKDSWDEACKAGLFDGTAPRDFMTREETAVVLNRLKKS